MARRKKAKRRRGPKKFSVISAIESYAYANLLTQGLAGNTPVGFITSRSDIVYGSSNGAMTVTGADQLSLSEIITHPTTAFTGMQANFMSNYQTMAVQAIGIGVGFKVARKLLRRPISNVNRNIMKPLGIGIKL
jgi:hypothetical protein